MKKVLFLLVVLLTTGETAANASDSFSHANSTYRVEGVRGQSVRLTWRHTSGGFVAQYSANQIPGCNCDRFTYGSYTVIVYFKENSAQVAKVSYINEAVCGLNRYACRDSKANKEYIIQACSRSNEMYHIDLVNRRAHRYCGQVLGGDSAGCAGPVKGAECSWVKADSCGDRGLPSYKECPSKIIVSPANE